MLSFGIFASGTPFFVMAGLYLFYMLLNLGVRFNQNEEQLQCADVDNQLIAQYTIAETQVKDPSLLVLLAKDVKKDVVDDFQQNTYRFAIWPPPQSCLRCFPEHIYLKEIPLSNLFSRPPPVA